MQWLSMAGVYIPWAASHRFESNIRYVQLRVKVMCVYGLVLGSLNFKANGRADETKPWAAV